MLKKMNRRDFNRLLGAMALSPVMLESLGSARSAGAKTRGFLVNDVHSQINPTSVKQILQPSSTGALRNAIELAKKQNSFLSICGGRHAGGGQQFGTESILVDTRKFNRVLNLDREQGLLEVQAGIMWPELLHQLDVLQKGSANPWNIKQKQTGGDNISIGGTLSANAHGQGLTFKPFISDVESFTLLDARGELHNCSRSENYELFKLVIGGFGLFGLIYKISP